MTTQESTDEGRPKEIPNLRPPDDWELNAFLVEVSNMVEEEDLERMKLLCTGKGGFGRGVLEKLDNLKFFDLLRQSERITKHNLIFLQALLWSIGRIDIHKKFVEFSRSNEDILHIFAPKEAPENGYKYVKFHIGGDTGNYSSQLLRDMRTNVARLLRVPERFVFVSGIEPSSSLLITLMVPEDVVYIILEMTEKEMSELLQYHVIDITVEDKVIRMRGKLISQNSYEV
ncbi:hypothetical protein FSP39_002230 [Pinctada imbricata]|uniref:DED domain-containing protein n=1 Tax=Pinctada imbricata TaxID=66713 RepID=A0AA88XFS5_PINIB|nr:hypothetical protein FSP39_002230 [Pinctada imbricata]